MAKKPTRERFTDGPEEFRRFMTIRPVRRIRREAALRPKVRAPKVDI